MKKVFILLSFCIFAMFSFAEDIPFIDEVSMGIGESKDNINIYRLSAKKNFESIFHKNKYGTLTGYYEAAINYWEKEDDQIYGIALSPVFVYYIGNMSDTIKPYVEAGIGAAFISDTNIKGRDMTTYFQFEDRIGLGFKLKSFDFNTRYIHYSNANIKQPNQGIDIFMFTVSYIF